MTFEVPIPVGAAIIAAGMYVFWLLFKKKVESIAEIENIPESIGEVGFQVPILASFKGIKGIPSQLTYAQNSIKPTLMLYDERLECRVWSNKSIPYTSIAKIDIWDTIATRNLTITIRGRIDTFTANLFSRSNLTEVLSHMRKKGVPLSSRAREFLNSQQAENAT